MHRAVSTTDTIAAIATASGEAAIAVVRLSGPLALAIADRVFVCRGKPLSERAAFTFVHGRVWSAAGVGIDEVIALVWRAPRSYTGEDVVEIHCHAGRAVTQQVLRSLLDCGARAAEPGEFTRRAFLNGRMDLIQAEAVLDLIRAESDRSSEAAFEQLTGSLSIRLTNIYRDLIDTAADIEATLDFGEDDVLEAALPKVAGRLRAIIGRIDGLSDTWAEGLVLRDGALVVIAGSPNVGKSTLLNALLGKPRAIVTPVPGTTRDLIEENLTVGGVLVRLVDTAGLREPQCEVEREGVERARAMLARADLCLHVIDASVLPSADELTRIGKLDPARVVLVLNKSDLGVRVGADTFPGHEAVTCSLLRDASAAAQIRDRVANKVAPWRGAVPHAVISERHKQVLEEARHAVNEAFQLVSSDDQANVVLAASSMRAAAERLGEMTGRTYSEDLLDKVFSRFCVGK